MPGVTCAEDFMKLRLIQSVLLFAIGVSNVHAVLIFSDRNAFIAAGGPAVIEDFEDANVPPNNVCNTGGPLDAATNNACVGAGDIVAGVSFAAGGGQLEFLGSGTLGGASITLGTDFLFTNLNLIFTPAVQAVGFDFFALGGAASNAVVISLGPSGAGTITGAVATGSFFGAIAEPGEPLISGVVIAARPAPSFGTLINPIDNLAFGAVAGVPEPGTLMLLLLPLTGVCALRRLRLRPSTRP